MTNIDSEEEATKSIVRQVAKKAMLYRYYHWDWGEAIAMEGLWLAYQITGKEEFGNFVRKMVQSWVSYTRDPWYPDHVGPGYMLLVLWEESGDLSVLSYAKLLGDHLIHLPRSSFGAYFHRPDLPDRAKMVWVDSIQTDAPFLCALARATGERRWQDYAVDHIMGHVQALQDPRTGLFHHNYNDAIGQKNGCFWGRGNGWAAL